MRAVRSDSASRTSLFHELAIHIDKCSYTDYADLQFYRSARGHMHSMTLCKAIGPRRNMVTKVLDV